jgi:Lon protease-like protein
MTTVPLFPLGTVVFPGVVTPLHIFEDRYVSLVRDLMAKPAAAERVFGIVAIREGYEVSQGFQSRDGGHQFASAHRVGTLVQLTTVEEYEDGRYDIEVTGRQRFRVADTDPTGPYLLGEVQLLEDRNDPGAAEAAVRALATFRAYRSALSAMRGGPVLVGAMPRDPAYLSYSLAATCLLTLPQRQALLEVPDAAQRLRQLSRAMREEMRAMTVLPSLPATEVARTRWSPN